LPLVLLDDAKKRKKKKLFHGLVVSHLENTLFVFFAWHIKSLTRPLLAVLVVPIFIEITPNG